MQVSCPLSELPFSKELKKQALCMLWGDVTAVPSPSKTPGWDADLACNLIRLVQGLALSLFVSVAHSLPQMKYALWDVLSVA